MFTNVFPDSLANALVSDTPYLQAVSSNSIFVLIEKSNTTPLDVQFGPSTSYGMTAKTTSTAKTSEGTYIHRIKLEGLEAGKTYHYRIGSSGADYTFRTAVSPGSSFKFGWIADTRTNTSIHDKIANKMISENPSFSLYGGDLCGDSSYSSFQKEFFINSQKKLITQVPFFNSVGNHEGWSTNTKAFTYGNEKNQEYYSFDYGDLHIVNINTDGSLSSGSAQWNFVKNDLATTKKQWKIIYYHKPAYNSGGHGENSNMVKMAKEIFVPNKVDMTLSGDSHYYQRNYVDNIYHVIIGSAGAPLYSPEKASYTQKSLKSYCYGVFDVSPTNFNLTVKNENGETIDTIKLSKNAPTETVQKPTSTTSSTPKPSVTSKPAVTAKPTSTPKPIVTAKQEPTASTDRKIGGSSNQIATEPPSKNQPTPIPPSVGKTTNKPTPKPSTNKEPIDRHEVPPIENHVVTALPNLTIDSVPNFTTTTSSPISAIFEIFITIIKAIFNMIFGILTSLLPI
jgi:predicted phosphodiesterase